MLRWVGPADNVLELLFLEDSVGFLNEIVDAGRQGGLLLLPGLGCLGRLGLREVGKQLDGGHGFPRKEGRRLPGLVVVLGHSFHGANIIYF